MRTTTKRRSRETKRSSRRARRHRAVPFAACTIISRNYLAHARVLAESFQKHHPGATFYLFVVDRLPSNVELGANVQLIAHDDLQLPYFYELCFKYDVTELCTALKPTLLATIIGRFGENAVAYFDPDILIARPLEEIEESLRDAAIVLTPHLLEPIPMDARKPSEEDILRDGSYNLGFIAVKKSPEAARFLSWWEERLRNGCRVDRPAGLFTDQKWIDLVPALFPSHSVLRDDAYNVAYWNLHSRKLTARRGRILVNARPLAFFHFSGFNPSSPGTLSKHQNRIEPAEGTTLAGLLAQYADRLYEKGYSETNAWNYGFSSFENGIRVHPILRSLYLNLSQDERARFGDPFRTTGKGTFLGWATTPSQIKESISPFLKAIHGSRYDLAAAYADPAGADREQFLTWASSQGAREMGYDPRLASNQAVTGEASPEFAPARHPRCFQSPAPVTNETSYRRMLARIEHLAAQLPSDGVVVCVSKGDAELLPATREAWHFPQAADGSYAGYYPADSRQAIDHLEALHRKGADYFLLPASSSWWLDHYAEFREHLYSHYEIAMQEDETCTIFDLTSAHRSNGREAGQGKSRTPPRPDFGVNVAGYLSSEKGIGEGVRSDIRSLEAIGIPFSVNDFVDEGSVNFESFYRDARKGQHYPVNLVHVNADQVRQFIKTHGDVFFDNRYNIGYWAWELSHFPDEWRESFRHFDEIWVPSNFTLDAVSRAAPIPVVRIPHSLPEELPRAAKERSNFGLPEDRFIFMFAFDFHSYFERKNPLALIRAFKKAFTQKDDVTLVLKGAHPREGQARMLRQAAEGADVRFVDTLLTREETNTFLSLSDCYVSLHRSEGFGLTMAEAMVLGKPVIATGYSGNLDFMTPSNSFLVGYQLTRIEKNYGPYRKGNVWADPDVEHAAELMRRVYEDRADAARVGEIGRLDILSHFSPRAVGAIMSNRLSQCLNQTRRPLSQSGGGSGELVPVHDARPDPYQEQVAAIQELIKFTVPADATVLVVSRGDGDLLALGARRAWHFPQLDDGRYAGYYPADSAQAIEHLESMRAKGAQFLVFPSTAYWWLEHYRELCTHLDSAYRRIWGDARCMIYQLSPSQGELRAELLAEVTDRLNTASDRLDHLAANAARCSNVLLARPYMAEDIFGMTRDPSEPLGYGLDAAGAASRSGRIPSFADLFRGTEPFIAERQRVYLPFFQGREKIVDLGCGRGEFLRLLKSAGIAAQGVESDPALVERLKGEGLDVVQADVVDFVKTWHEGSLDAIFCSQVIEHLEPPRLEELIATAFTRLKRGGLFIAETVNPECLQALKVFHVDPTHQRPLFPQVLLYMFLRTGYPSARVYYPYDGGFTQKAYSTSGEYGIVALV